MIPEKFGESPVYDVALEYVDRYPQAAGVGVAFADRDGQVLTLAAAAVVEDSAGRAIGRERLAALSGAAQREALEIAAIRACQCARFELAKVVADLT